MPSLRYGAVQRFPCSGANAVAHCAERAHRAKEAGEPADVVLSAPSRSQAVAEPYGGTVIEADIQAGGDGVGALVAIREPRVAAGLENND